MRVCPRPCLQLVRSGGNRLLRAVIRLARGYQQAQQQRYWEPRDDTEDIVIVLGSDGQGDREHFRNVQAAGRVGVRDL